MINMIKMMDVRAGNWIGEHLCHGDCSWGEDSCQENKPLPVYKGSGDENYEHDDDVEDGDGDDYCVTRLSNVPHGDGRESSDGFEQMSVG